LFKKSLASIAILFKYAPGLTVLKLSQIGLSAVLAPLSIYFTQRIIDAAAEIPARNGSLSALVFWGGLLVFSMFFSSVGNGFLNGILLIAIKRRLNIGMTPDILEKFKRLDYACFEDRDVQDTLERMSSDPQEKVFQLFLTILAVMECAVGVLGAALIFSQVGWWFTAGFAALLGPMIWLDFKAADMMNTMMNNQSADERKMHYLGGLLSNKASLFELKIFRSVDYVVQKWRGIAHTVLTDRVKTTINSQKYFLVSTILFKCWSFFIILGLVSTIAAGNITIGLFTALVTSTGLVLDNAGLLSHVVQNLRARYLLMDHYYKFMALPEIQEGAVEISGTAPQIIFENVSFTYPKTENKILNAASFTIESGECAALVGENGAGKSTIIKLLCRLYKPDSGHILIDGQDIRNLDTASLRSMFSVVFQDYCRYTLSLRENVAFGDLSKLHDDAALNNALKMGLAENIAPLDAQLGKLEDDGIDLSGGQWQRVALARACLPESAFIILDEPTASLDPLAESDMYHSFTKILKNRGCILISHRLASARMADKILVLDKGVISETGSHGELMASGGLYSKMYESQSAWYTTQGAAE
jgi:ABC-type multidrug transport system fused ATPase/permease subunit